MKVLTMSAVSHNSPSPTITDHFEVLADDFGVEFDHVFIPVDEPGSYRSGLTELRRRLAGPTRYDLVHAFYGHSGLLARLQLRAPLLITFQGSDLLGGHEGYVHGRDGRIGRFAARFARRIVVMSEEMKAVSGRSDARVIPFGVNTELFVPRPRAEACAEMGLDPDGTYVLFPYDPDRPEKNFTIAEAAVEALTARGTDVELLTIYGRDRQEVAALMNACDVLVMVSDHEGSPVAVREALACNLPVVSFDVGDVGDLLPPFPNCHVVDRSVTAVADALGLVAASGRRTTSSEIVSKSDVFHSAGELFSVYCDMLVTGK